MRMQPRRVRESHISQWSPYAHTPQDYEPSADHWANHNQAIQLMLMQPADDGYAAGTTFLFPAWPCSIDVAFKLHGPLNTTIEVDYAGGALRSFNVDPPARRAAVRFAACVQQ